METKFFVVLLLTIAFLAPAISAQAYTDDQLAQTFAPVMKFNSNENFYVCSVDYDIQNSNLMQSGSVVDSSPTENSISSRGDGYYLDNRLGWFPEIAADYKSKIQSLTPIVYYHVVHSGGDIGIQYWFHYAFNDGPLNLHEGDWETMTVVLQAGTPTWAGYSEHESGARLAWADVEKVADTHPVVYVGRGSHANYFRSYSGKFGLQNDDVGGGGITISPASIGGNMQLSSLDSNPPWLSFGGRWGYSGDPIGGVTGSNGPYGPSAGDHATEYNNPLGWAMSLPQTGGGTFALEWVIFNFALLFIIYLIAIGAWKVFGIFRRAKSKEGLQVKKFFSSSFAIWLILGIVGIVLVLIGSILTWYSVSGNVQMTGQATGSGIPNVGAPGGSNVNLLSFNGMEGLKVNMLQNGGGMTNLFSFVMPIGVILLASVLFTIFDIIGAKSGKSLGAKYLLGGIMPIVFFIIIIVAIASLTSLIPNLAASMSGGQQVPGDMAGLLTSVSRSPLSGGFQGPIGGYANVNLAWGLGIGAYLMLIGGIIRILAGIAMIASAPKDAPTPKKPAQQVVVYQQPQQYQQSQQYQPQQYQYPQQYQQPQQYAYQQQPQQYQQPAQSGQRFCKKCGTPTREGTSFCDNCGARVK